jgi:hypothetical protein
LLLEAVPLLLKPYILNALANDENPKGEYRLGNLGINGKVILD